MKIYSEELYNLREVASKIIGLIKKADSDLKHAESVREASVRLRSSFTDILTKTDKCVSDLATAISSASKAVAKARQVLDECDYNQAQTLIDALPPGTDKTQLTGDLKAGLALEKDLKSLANQARSAYKACDYAQALTLIQQARQNAKCTRHIASLNDKITNIQAAQRLEAELKALVNKARAKYKDCRPGEALTVLNQALAKAKCDKHRQSLKKKIALAQKKRKHEKTTLDLFGKAKKLYANGRYSDAKALLLQARAHTTCQRYRDSLDKKIARANEKLGSGDGGQRQPGVCAGFVDQLKAQAREVSRLARHYSSIGRDTPNSPFEVRGPSACRLVGGSDLFGRIMKQATEAGCAQVNAIEDPAASIYAAAENTCQIFKRRSGDESESPSCRRYKRRKADAAAAQNRLIERYKNLERNRAANAQKKPTACAILAKGKEISRIMNEVIQRGCNVGGHTVWLPRSIKPVCNQTSQQRDSSQLCSQYGKKMGRIMQRMNGITSQMASLSRNRHGARAALERLACQLVDEVNKMKQAVAQAKASRCNIISQVNPDMYQRMTRLCPGR